MKNAPADACELWERIKKELNLVSQYKSSVRILNGVDTAETLESTYVKAAYSDIDRMVPELLPSPLLKDVQDEMWHRSTVLSCSHHWTLVFLDTVSH